MLLEIDRAPLFFCASLIASKAYARAAAAFAHVAPQRARHDQFGSSYSPYVSVTIYSRSAALSSFEGQRSQGAVRGRRAHQLVGTIAGLALIALATDGCNPTILSPA